MCIAPYTDLSSGLFMILEYLKATLPVLPPLAKLTSGVFLLTCDLNFMHTNVGLMYVFYMYFEDLSSTQECIMLMHEIQDLLFVCVRLTVNHQSFAMYVQITCINDLQM